MAVEARENMKRKGAVRLARHYRFMKGVPKKGIVMSAFYRRARGVGLRVDEFPLKPPAKPTAECGTAACVAGWLPVAEPKHWRNKVFRQDSTTATHAKPVLRGRVVKQRFGVTYQHVMEWFGLCYQDVHDMCDPEAYRRDWSDNSEPSKARVLARMRKIAKRNGWDISSGKAVKIK